MHIYCKQFSCQVLVSTRKQIAFIENWLDLTDGIFEIGAHGIPSKSQNPTVLGQGGPSST